MASTTDLATAGAVLTVDLGAVVANWRALGARHPSGPAAGVVKADAYGLGAAAVAPALAAAGCRHFFVALPAEAIALRPRLPSAMIAVLGGLFPGTEAAFLAHDLTPVLNTLAEIDAWAGAARAVGRALSAILHVDTGMSRLGLDPASLAALAADPARLGGIDLRYVMTHLIASEIAADPHNAAQAAHFAQACAALPPAPRSLANSSAIFLGPGFGSDLARPGAALYGINPLPGEANPMRAAVRLSARVLAVRAIGAGESVGYNATFTATRPTRIATAAIGYADGWRRSLSNRGAAVFDGARLPLVGRVSMDLTTFDATAHPGLVAGDWLDLIGPGQSVDDVADAAGTNGYEVLTGLGPRIARAYLPA
ncbi:MAG: alanine racemase [Rhodospirillales bacterium]|nr:alanine racemase [Rhodospirillales bacterium]